MSHLASPAAGECLLCQAPIQAPIQCVLGCCIDIMATCVVACVYIPQHPATGFRHAARLACCAPQHSGHVQSSACEARCPTLCGALWLTCCSLCTSSTASVTLNVPLSPTAGTSSCAVIVRSKALLLLLNCCVTRAPESTRAQAARAPHKHLCVLRERGLLHRLKLVCHQHAVITSLYSCHR